MFRIVDLCRICASLTVTVYNSAAQPFSPEGQFIHVQFVRGPHGVKVRLCQVGGVTSVDLKKVVLKNNLFFNENIVQVSQPSGASRYLYIINQ